MARIEIARIAPAGAFGPARAARLRPVHGWIAASALAHLLVLGWLARTAIAPTPTAPTASPPIFIDIEPRPMLIGERPRTPSAAAPPLPTPILRSPSARVWPLDEDEAAVASAPPLEGSAGSVAPVPTAPADDRFRYVPESLGAAVGRTMRLGAAGCRTMWEQLSAAERDLCDERFNAAAGWARPLGPRTRSAGEARRDAQFARDGAQALARYEAQRAPLSGGVGVVGPADCVGSNLGRGCAGAHLPSVPGTDMRQGADSLIRQPSNKLRAPD